MSRLGPFELEPKPFGEGGMGAVFKGVHRKQGVPVAVKVIKPGKHDENEAFLNEVRLVAGLDHPNIVMVFDFGEVPAGTGLEPGSPYLAMELAGGGSLAGHRCLRWTALVHTLTSLLDGLAHAHARGIVHRDIKPANLLLAGSRSEYASEPRRVEDARIVLSDFGISRKDDEAELHEGLSVGTPTYMSPEQVRADWRDQGPWTDLYAVGILAWRLTTGTTPFRGRHSLRLMMAHLRDPVPAYDPAVPVPDGFEDWVRKLLEKDPADRFAYAADAKRALLSLGGATSRGLPIPAPDISDLPTERLPALSDDAALETVRLRPVAPGAEWMPMSWAETERRDFRLVGAGLGLFGLRALPLIDRKTERDALWGALVKVRTSGIGRAVVLRGTAGTGKSRIVEWLTATAHEAGAADALRAVHTPTPGAEHGLARMAARYLLTDGLAADKVPERVASQLGDYGVNGTDDLLARFVAPELIEGPVFTRRQRFRVVEQLLRAAAGERAVIVVLEDVQWNDDAIELARHLLARQERRPFPVLVVLTLREEAFDPASNGAAVLAELLEDGAEELRVGPLASEDHRELVASLGLEGSLAISVETRTAGNPLFAVQLVGSWVEEGLLVPSDRGFRLARGRTADIPADMVAVWRERIERLLHDRDADDAAAVELIAALGLEVRTQEWREACLLAGLRPAPDLLSELLRQRLARSEDERARRFSLVHGLLREALQSQAEAAGRWADHNLVCATLLERSRRADPSRLARHLLAAGRPDEATKPMLAAITDRLDSGDFRSSQDLEAVESVLGDLGLPREDPRWGELWLLWAWLFRGRGSNEEAERWIIRAERACRRFGWEDKLPRTLREGGRIELALGQPERALELLDEAEELFYGSGDQLRALDCRTAMGDAWLSLGNAEKADLAYRSAVAVIVDNEERDDIDFLSVAVFAWLGLAQVARHTGDLDGVIEALGKARSTARKARQHLALANAANLQGEVARARGDLDLAEECYREAARLYEAFDAVHATIPTLNLGVILVERGAYAEARGLAEALLADLVATGSRPVFAYYARAVLLPCAAAADDRKAFRALANAVHDFADASGVVDKDIAALARKAANECLAGGMLAEAVTAFAIAEDQYVGIGKDELAEEMRVRAARVRKRLP